VTLPLLSLHNETAMSAKLMSMTRYDVPTEIDLKCHGDTGESMLCFASRILKQRNRSWASVKGVAPAAHIKSSLAAPPPAHRLGSSSVSNRSRSGCSTYQTLRCSALGRQEAVAVVAAACSGLGVVIGEGDRGQGEVRWPMTFHLLAIIVPN